MRFNISNYGYIDGELILPIGGGEGDDDKTLKEGEIAISADELAKLKDSAGKADDLANKVGESTKKIEAYERDLMSDDYVAYLDNKSKGGAAGGGATPSKDEASPKWNDMSNDQMAQALEERIGKVLDAFGDKVGKSLDTFDGKVGKAFAEYDVKMIAIKHTDFGEALNTKEGERTDEQKTLIKLTGETAKSNPTWDAEKCLKEARRQIKESQDSAVEKAEKKKLEDLALLSEKSGAPDGTVVPKDMEADEAGDKAWEATMGNAATL